MVRPELAASVLSRVKTVSSMFKVVFMLRMENHIINMGIWQAEPHSALRTQGLYAPFMLDFLSTHGVSLLAQSGNRRFRRRNSFLDNLCGGPAETADWCQWQVTGFVALTLGGFWLLFQLAKWGLAPKDERETPQPLALVLASVILAGGLFVLASNQKPAASDETLEPDVPLVDPKPLIDPNG